MRLVTIALAALVAPSVALAHAAHGTADAGGGIASGFLHPFYGADHLVAMIAVGIWGVMLGAPLKIALPVAFPLMMAFGAYWSLFGLPLPAVEIGIAASALVLGIVIVFAFRPPLLGAIAIVGLFALFHGFAHGNALPVSTSPTTYVAGFVIGTGVLHLIGIALGEGILRLPQTRLLQQASGGLIALTGVVFLWGAVT